MNLEFNKENEKKVIAVAMSGGVDSSTVAYLLKKQGYTIFGVTMKTCGEEDKDAKRICDDLGIKHYLLDVTKEFKEDVIDYFVNEYKNGKTPNPCMVCNRHVKFGKLIDFALELGAETLATGHYANIIDGTLAIGDDMNKDQVYFLSQIKKENLKYIEFPIGKMEKPLVRELAKDLGVRVYAKKDSQEICFVEDGKLKEFLIEKTNGKIERPGKIVDLNGKVLGKHNGLAFYTIGQRKGLGISSANPLYVVKLDKKNNTVVVGDNDDLMRDTLVATQLNLLLVDKIDELDGMECYAKARSRDKLHLCRVNVIGEDMIEIDFIQDRIRAVTPGQGAVLYTEDGKVIASSYIVK
ncbi:tRNA 2-thiouridine(34) synthase MnmA [uncultured Cetobacterium sp.]|uniref:tRNA 2-thiouridine(34) synthase MnmA n=1 Tax=uncultured Cetobacterium sp. TaxID=527638 RepID=UPI00260FEFD3|nr:tRNA 2-thiouridine(34) synthase MnmA [uncultured Cetobacterium sp.]